MATLDRNQEIRFSVIDRLMSEVEGVGRPDDLTQLREQVRRDLEWLLNTRRIYLTVPDEYPELQRSVYHYGLPDITSLGRDAPATRARLASHMEEALALFEPRLSNVRISVSEGGADAKGQLHFVINALMAMDPEPVRVTFDTVVDRSSGGVAVRPGS